MDKKKALEQLKKALDEVPSLRTADITDGGIFRWRKRVGNLLEVVYGSKSAEYYRFITVPPATAAAAPTTEEKFQQEYQRQLDYHEGVLKSLISSNS